MILPNLVNNKFQENKHTLNAIMIIKHLKFNIKNSINFC
jgi:hypothetical protein